MRYLLLSFAAFLLSATAARAEWREAQTRHFIVYSEGSEERLRKAAENLEKYDFMLRAVTSTRANADRLKRVNPVRLKVYLMANPGEVADTMPFGGGGVLGYYNASARGPIAVGVRNDTDSGFGMSAQHVLFHEYAHHFMLQNFPAAYPAWYREGFAEYYGATRILDNDVIEVGHAATNRHLSFLDNRWISLDKLLAAKSYADADNKLDLLYAQGWLLVHYLSFTKERSGQLSDYLEAINRGQSYQKATSAAFGPGATQLNKELREYSRRGRLPTLQLPFKKIDVGPIRIRTLRPAEQALIGVDIALSAGVAARSADNLAASARKKAAQHADDPHAFAILAEAERLAGRNDAAVAAIDRWLALDPRSARALMQKGELRIEALRAANSTDKAAWAKARDLLFNAHKADPRDPLILLAYYDSFIAEGVLPPPGAQNGLVRAQELVPQDDDLRYLVAWDYEQRGMIAEAIAVIRPTAWEIHGEGEESERKKERREQLEKRYRLAGDQKRETAREMLVRLEKKAAEVGMRTPAEPGS